LQVNCREQESLASAARDEWPILILLLFYLAITIIKYLFSMATWKFKARFGLLKHLKRKVKMEIA